MAKPKFPAMVLDTNGKILVSGETTECMFWCLNHYPGFQVDPDTGEVTHDGVKVGQWVDHGVKDTDVSDL